MCSSAHPWRRLRLWTINMNDQHEIIRKQWKPRYVLALLEFVQECLLSAVVESNKQVWWLKYGKDGNKNYENVDTLCGFYVCHETKVLTIISRFRPSDLSLYFVKVLSGGLLIVGFFGSGTGCFFLFGSLDVCLFGSIMVTPNVNWDVESNWMRF